MSENVHDNQPQPSKGRKVTKGNGPILPVDPSERPADALSEFEEAIAGPNGIETASSDSAADDADEALAEIEEAISNGDDEDVIEVEESNLSYPIRKPFRSKKKFEFFMTHPDPAMWIKAWVVIENFGMEENYHLPTGAVRDQLLDHLVQVEFVPGISSRAKVFICPIPCESVTGRVNSWTKSLRDAALEARTRLTKILSDQDEGRYRIFHPRGKNVPLPEFPKDFTRKTMLARMFRDHVLRNLDNDVAREILNAGKKIEK
jgi:hypothetical protein